MKKASVVVIIIILLLTGISLYNLGIKPVYSYVPEEYSESDTHLNNPYEGMYHIYSFKLSDKEPVSTDSAAAALGEDDYRLALVEIDLSEYNSCELSDSALTQLDDILSLFDATGCDVILRLLYDTTGHAETHEPHSISTVRLHILAAAPIINKHVESIFTLQGLLIGNYGEIHDSHLINDDNLCLLTDLLYSQIDKDIYLAVRTPAQWRLITKAGSPESDRGLTSRLGLFNDGLLGSDTDLGSYDLRSREREYEYQSVLCNHVPNGGEVVNDNTYNNYEPARAVLEDIHISYLNSEYDPAVLNKWKAATETTDPVWRGKSGYEYIENHLGYRFYLSFSELRGEDPDMDLRITLKNLGFAPSYKPFRAYLTLHPTGKKAKGDILLEVPTTLDTLIPGETRSVDIPLPMERLENTDYEVWFYILDEASGEIILPANNNLKERQLMIGTINCRSLLKK